jgi:hypothetical protein
MKDRKSSVLLSESAHWSCESNGVVLSAPIHSCSLLSCSLLSVESGLNFLLLMLLNGLIRSDAPWPGDVRGRMNPIALRMIVIRLESGGSDRGGPISSRSFSSKSAES